VFEVLAIQYAVRMRSVILSSVACLALQYFPHAILNGMIFGVKNGKNVCFIYAAFVGKMSHSEMK